MLQGSLLMLQMIAMSGQVRGRSSRIPATGAQLAPMRATGPVNVGILILAGCVGLAACTNTTAGHPSDGSSGSPILGPSDTMVRPGTPFKGPRVTVEALQKIVTDQLVQHGGTPQSVVCQQDLIGQLGQSTRCDVTVTPGNSFEPIITVIGVNGSNINYVMVPSVNKGQLETAVANMITRSTKTAPDSVSCESGLDGKVGATAFCDVTTAGTTIRQAVAVNRVQGLSMNYGLVQPGSAPGRDAVPVPGNGRAQTLPKSVAEGALMAQLRHTGQHPDSATCAGDMVVQVGATLPCTAVTAGQSQNYVLTISAVVNGNITFNVAPVQ
jgi:hypothetical protein